MQLCISVIKVSVFVYSHHPEENPWFDKVLDSLSLFD